jgi:thymidylate synthase
MNNLDKQYQQLLQDILDNGYQKGDRTGTGTKSVFGRQIRHKMSEGFPLLTTKKMAWNAIVVELLWFLRGGTNIKYLLDHDVHIWDGDAYKNYLKKTENKTIDSFRGCEISFIENHGTIAGPISKGYFRQYTKEEFIEKIKSDPKFADKWGELGPIYGEQWRFWRKSDTEFIDQILTLIHTLKINPDDRRMMVTAWNPAELSKAVLPPCHYGFQVYTRELSIKERYRIYQKQLAEHPLWKNSHTPQFGIDDMNKANVPTREISLMWNQRSVDTFLGLPFNIASYGLLLEILGKICNMVPGELIGNLGDTHVYNNHIDQAAEQIARTPFELPTLKINRTPFDYLEAGEDFDNFIVKLEPSDFQIENYQSHDKIKAPLSN